MDRIFYSRLRKAIYIAKQDPESKITVLYVVDAATSRAGMAKIYNATELDQVEKQVRNN